MPTEQDVDIPQVDFDHTDQAFAKDPNSRFSQFRRECPVAHSPRHGGFWMLSRYDDILNATRDTDTFSSAAGISLPPIGSMIPLPPLEVDPPEHTHFRRILQQEFSRGRMEALEGDIRTVAVDLIEAFAERGSGDLATELATPLPAIVIAQLMGFPSSDWRKFFEYTEQLIEASRTGNMELGMVAATAFLDLLRNALDDRRTQPRDDMLTRIASSRIGDRAVTDLEALGIVWTTVVAGHETTVGGIGSLVLRLGTDAALTERLRADRSLIPRAIEETVRMDAPIQGMLRTVTRDVCVRDQQLRAGDKVWLMFSSANRDEEQFTYPDEFDLDRKPNRHLGFGDGVHRCIGAPLAQLEMRIVAEEVLDRLPNLRVADVDDVTYESTQSRKVTHLPCTW